MDLGIEVDGVDGCGDLHVMAIVVKSFSGSRSHRRRCRRRHRNGCLSGNLAAVCCDIVGRE